jgi:hypothetical protein
MVGLLDVNVLIALFDPAHIHHEATHRWFRQNRKQGWATCPLTENGLVRILSNPGYPGRRTSPEDARGRLSQFSRSGHHHFWADSLSVRDESVFDMEHVSGHRQITDVYLLGLAARNGGRLVSLDGGIPVAAVSCATARNLLTIPV